MVGLVSWSLISGVAADAALRTLDATFAVRDLETPPGAVKPTTELRSGSDESLIEWESLGREGRAFLGRGPTADEITELTGRPAIEPIRAYAGLGNAEDAEARAALAVDDLERAGGFDRTYLLVITTTGTGWVEPSSVNGFEYVTGGDSAIVGMQYSHLASWLSFLVDAARAREAGRALFDAVYERWSACRATTGPSSTSSARASARSAPRRRSAASSTSTTGRPAPSSSGRPTSTRSTASFVDGRDAGRARSSRSTATGGSSASPPGRAAPAGGPAVGAGSRALYLQHASDPVTWWTSDLVLTRPDWLEERRGDDVPGDMRWIPFVTFLQVSADLAGAFSTQPAHGHNFSGEHAAAW